MSNKTTIWGRELPLVVIQNKHCMDRDFPGVELPKVGYGETIKFDYIMEGKPVQVSISSGKDELKVWRVRISEKIA